MLLPKRVKKRMTEDEIIKREKQIEEQELELKKKALKTLVNSQKTEDSYIIDDENAIIVIKNNKDQCNDGYIMIHQRLIDGKLVKINSWNIRCYYFGCIHNVTVLKELNLFQVQNNNGNFNALYDYKKGKFVVPQGIWGTVEAGRNNKYIDKYNGFIASFCIRSDYEEDDVYSYINPVTNEKIVESFGISDGNYYAIINIDGTIRGNKLFKGNQFSKISEIIDLNQYESLMEFKKERKQLCNDKKKKQKQEYQEMIKLRNDGSISPYLDSEVAKVLEIKI